MSLGLLGRLSGEDGDAAEKPRGPSWAWLLGDTLSVAGMMPSDDDDAGEASSEIVESVGTGLEAGRTFRAASASASRFLVGREADGPVCL